MVRSSVKVLKCCTIVLNNNNKWEKHLLVVMYDLFLYFARSLVTVLFEGFCQYVREGYWLVIFLKVLFVLFWFQNKSGIVESVAKYSILCCMELVLFLSYMCGRISNENPSGLGIFSTISLISLIYLGLLTLCISSGASFSCFILCPFHINCQIYWHKVNYNIYLLSFNICRI